MSNLLENKELLEYSEMSAKEREFVLKMLDEIAPKRILEVGVSAGGNTALILDSLCNNKKLAKSELVSLDFSEYYYHDLENGKTPQNARKTGFLAEKLVPKALKKWELHTGGLACRHLERLGEFDMLILDTTHRAPGEILDFLMCLPSLKSGACVILHDLIFHILCARPQWNVCALLFSTLKGRKIFPATEQPQFFGNIGACILDENQKEKGILEQYFRLLNGAWCYIPQVSDLQEAQGYFNRCYGEEYGLFLAQIFQIQQEWIQKGVNQNALNLPSIKAQITALANSFGNALIQRAEMAQDFRKV